MIMHMCKQLYVLINRKRVLRNLPPAQQQQPALLALADADRRREPMSSLSLDRAFDLCGHLSNLREISQKYKLTTIHNHNRGKKRVHTHFLL